MKQTQGPSRGTSSHDEDPVDCQLETVQKVGAHFPMASESVTFPTNGKEV